MPYSSWPSAVRRKSGTNGFDFWCKGLVDRDRPKMHESGDHPFLASASLTGLPASRGHHCAADHAGVRGCRHGDGPGVRCARRRVRPSGVVVPGRLGRFRRDAAPGLAATAADAPGHDRGWADDRAAAACASTWVPPAVLRASRAESGLLGLDGGGDDGRHGVFLRLASWAGGRDAAAMLGGMFGGMAWGLVASVSVYRLWYSVIDSGAQVRRDD
jgi:hypothetical protein